MAKRRDLYEMPAEVGNQRVHPLTLLSIPLVILATNVAATQLVAARMGYNPTLGRPPWAVHLAGISLYLNPLSWLAWSWLFLEPLGGYDYLHHVGRWPAVVYGALWALPSVFGAGLVALVAVPIVAQLTLGRARKDDVSQIVDSGHFAEPHEVKDLLEAQSGPALGLVDGKLVRYTGNIGLEHFEPSGGGKSTAVLIPNLLRPLRDARFESWDAARRRRETWGEEPSWVVFDPAYELIAKTSEYQRKVLGKKIYHLDPLGTDPGLSHFNPCWSVEIGTDREQQGCRRLIGDVVDPQGKGFTTFWDRTSSTFAEAIVAKVGYRSLNHKDPKLFSMPGIIDYIDVFASLKELCEDMVETWDDPNAAFGWIGADGKPTKGRQWIANAAKNMLGMAAAPETQRNVFDSLVQHLGIYRDPGLRRNICDSTFSFGAIANEAQASVVYIAAEPLDVETVLQPYLRLVTRAALRELTIKPSAVGVETVRGNLRPTILALDEVATLGRLDELETLSGTLRKNGVMLWFLWQDPKQLRRLYPEQSFSGNLGVHLYGKQEDPESAKAIAEQFGQFSQTLTRRNASGDRWSATPLGHVNENVDVVTRQLLTAVNLLNFPSDEILIRMGGRVIRAKKNSFFNDDALIERATMGCVDLPDIGLTEPPYHTKLRAALGPARFAQLFDRGPAQPKKAKTQEKPKQNVDGALARALAALITEARAGSEKT